MEKMGPSLELLIRRLSETPEAFLQHPKSEKEMSVYVPALINDFLVKFLLAPNLGFIKEFDHRKMDPNQLVLSMLVVWLLNDDSCTSLRFTENQIRSLFIDALTELSALGPAKKFILNHERREEFTRTVLARLDYRPEGETIHQARDRLVSLSTVERQRLIRDSKAAEKRAREVREALIRKAAEASADKWTRE